MRSVLRKTVPTTALVLAATGLAATVPASALGGSRDAGQLASATNNSRSHYRLRHYAGRSDLNTIARRWAAHMAARRTLGHNPQLASEVRGWRSVGENVGVGPSVPRLESAFMRSTEHRDNILSRSFTQFGVGAARGSDGRLYVDVVFRRPS